MPPLKLESFESDPEAAVAQASQHLVLTEDARLQAYEQGYGAGWEDAVTAQTEDQSRIRADLARNLQALGFTYHEARNHVLRAVAPLLQDMIGQLLPQVAREALAPTVLDTLLPMAEHLADAPVSVVLNPAARPAVEALLAQTALPVSITEEPTLGEGQVYLRLGPAETHVDLDRATALISQAVRGFFGLSEQEHP